MGRLLKTWYLAFLCGRITDLCVIVYTKTELVAVCRNCIAFVAGSIICAGRLEVLAA